MILTDEIRELPEAIASWMERDVKPHVAALEESGEPPLHLYKAMTEMGLNAICAPKEYNGLDLSTVEITLINETLGYYDCGLGSTVGVNSSVAHLINTFASEEQKKYYYELVLPDGWGAFCLTEPNAGSDAGNISTKAVADGDDYIINGVKCFSTNGGMAAAYCVFATVDPALGLKGITCFLIERDRPGVSVGKEENKMGIRLSNTTDVIFQDVRIPKSNMIGKVGGGFKIAMGTLDQSRLDVGALAVGLAQRALDESVNYAKTRVQFKRPIGDLQGIQFMLADMAMDVESARALVYHAAEIIDAQLPYTKFSSMGKCRGADVAMKVTVDAVQIFGGYGYMREYPLEKMMRDAKILQIYEGTNQVQRTVIARELLK